MAESILQSTEHLRRAAYDALKASEAFRAFKALDDAVAAMGGQRLLAVQGGVTINGSPVSAFANGSARPEINPPRRRRVSQAEGAEQVLKEQRRPMTSAELIEAVRQKGVTVGGDKPLMSFGSTLSRDPRFTNHRRDGLYYWWLAGKELPEAWNEAEPDDFAGLLGSASSSSSQEGGESHAATT